MIADPDMAFEFYTAKNAIFDKTGAFEAAFSPIMKHSFLFSRADEGWKAKRKACAHAFYKNRMVQMLETLKDKISERCEEWVG